MKIIQVVINKKLLQATDLAPRRTNRNRSALVCDALREHLRNLSKGARVERDRQGYSKQPPKADEFRAWEAEARWPEE